MISTLLDACQFFLETEGEPQSGLWLASQVEEMKLWRATEDKVRKALKQDIKKLGESSRFVECPTASSACGAGRPNDAD
jgi:hypothetical protein